MRYHTRLILLSLLLFTISMGIIRGNSSSAVFSAEQAPAVFQSDHAHKLDKQPITLSGWFTIIWGDPHPDTDVEPLTLYMLTDKNGRMTRLSVDEDTLPYQEGALALNGHWVQVTGSWIHEKVFQISSFDVALNAMTESMETWTTNVHGNQPYISILCKFANNSDEPKPLSYFQEMYSSEYPGLDHYWRELSDGEINVSGSNAVGWYTLPHERSYYVRDWDGDGDTEVDSDLLAKDCTGVADSEVYFLDYAGLNLMFNDELGGYASGGKIYLDLDGVPKLYGVTWEPPWAYSNLSLVEHEMGHSFGLFHSIGIWDVMSDPWSLCVTWDSEHGCLGQHTISYHKDRLGWIPEGQKYVSLPLTAQTVTLERLALPLTDNYKMAQIPIHGSDTHFYTVEVRETVGYDAILPDSAVIIHEVDTTRREPAHVIDVDGDGDTDDEGAMWRVGETFYDAVNTVSVSVDAKTESGFVITINYMPVPSPLSPIYDAIMPPGDVTLSWTAIQGVSQYDLQIDTKPTFDSPNLMTFTQTSNSLMHTFSTPGEYYWRVRGSVEASYSSVSRFTTIARPLIQLTTNVGNDDNPSIFRTVDGTLWIVWNSDRSGNSDIWYKTSSDGGTTWSAAAPVTADGLWNYNPVITYANDGTLWVVWSSNRSGSTDIWYKTSSDGGATWSTATPLTTDEYRDYRDYSPAITQTNDGTLWVVWEARRFSEPKIWHKTSSDGGVTWSTATPLTWRYSSAYHATITQAADGTLWVMWSAEASDNYDNDDIWYKTSNDNGIQWSVERRWSRFGGSDRSPVIASLGGNDVGVVWTSKRSGSDNDIWFGIPGKQGDINPPPLILNIHHEPWPNPYDNDVITITAYVGNESGTVDVELLWDINGFTQTNMAMLDDGAHGDGDAGDGLYGVQIGPLNAETRVTYTVRATNMDNNSYTYPTAKSFQVLAPFTKTTDILLVIDGNGEEYLSFYTDVLDGLYRYDVWESDLLGPPDESVLNQYVNGIVIWWANSSYYMNWKAADVITYLEAGGSLFVTGEGLANGIEYPPLLRDYLHAIYKQYDTGLFSLKGVAEDPIGDSLTLSLSGGDGADNHQWEKNEIDPIAPAEAIFKYDPDSANMMYQSISSAVGTREGKTLPLSKAGPAENISSGTAALRVDTGTYKAVFFAFGFEGINSLVDRFTVMERVISWLGSASPSGALGAPTCDVISGWAGDKDNPNRPVDVHFYADGTYNTGTFIGEVSADAARESAVCDALGGVHCDACPADEPQCKHGFTLSHIPAWLKDGESHNIYAYAINLPDSGGDAVSLLSGVPKAFRCQVTPTPSPTPFTITDQLWLPMLMP